MRFSLLLTIEVMLAAAAQGQEPRLEEMDTSRAVLTLDNGGHVGKINAMLFTRDGKRLVTAGSDKTIQVWDVQTRERLRVFRPPIGPGSEGTLNAAALAPDDRTLAVAAHGFKNHPRDKFSINHTFLLNLEDGRILRLLGPTNISRAIAFSADGDQLAAGSFNRIWIWRGLKDVWSRPRDDNGLKPAQEFGTKEFVALHLAFSPDARRLVVVHDNSALCRLWDLEPKEGPDLIATLGARTGLFGNAVAAAWSPDGKRIAIGYAWDPARPPLRLWSRDGKLEKVFGVKDLGEDYVKASKGGVHTRNVFFRSDSELLYSSINLLAERGIYRTIDLIDVPKGTVRPLYRLDGNVERYGRPGGGFSADGKRAALPSAHSNGAVVVDLDGEPRPRTLHAAPAPYLAGWGVKGYTVAWSSKDPSRLSTSLDLTRLELRDGIDPKEFNHTTRARDGWKLSLSQGEHKVVVERDGKEVCRTENSADVSDYTLPASGEVPWVAWTGSFGGFYLSEPEKGKTFRTFGPRDMHCTSISSSPDAKYLLASTDRENLCLFSSSANRFEQGYPLLTIFVHGPDWIAWTKEGYYAASPGGERLMGWTVNNGPDKLASFYPAERFRKQLYRPDIIKLLLAKGNVKDALVAANAALRKEGVEVKETTAPLDKLLPPRVTLSIEDKSKLPEVKVRVESEAGVKEQPIQALRLLVDGRPLPGKQALAEYRDGKAKASVEWTVTFPAGKHQLAVLARSADASAISNEVEIDCRPPEEKPVLHVIAIGVNEYKDRDLNLKCAANDADGISKAFAQSSKGEVFGAVRTSLLTNREATRPAILKAIEELRTDEKKKVKDNDVVVVFFAGHGATKKNAFYLLTHEADLDDLDKTALSGAKLREALGAFPCQVLLILDACHAGAFGGTGKLTRQEFKPATDMAARSMADSEVGVAVMCAAMGYERSEERAGNGLFTRALIEALSATKGVPYNEDNGKQYVHHLQAFAFDRVTRESGERQHPFLHMPWTMESFALRLVPSSKK